jgi:hypothetical protein
MAKPSPWAFDLGRMGRESRMKKTRKMKETEKMNRVGKS